ncbi:hypothetical protein U91I_02074 [alpha proteobacterium U9-1i]|nr:hypothetical protein U91I_02074 [alpha proteobacterium U9-1i]
MQRNVGFLAGACALLFALAFSASPGDAQPAADQTLSRPADLALWPSLGTTVRTDPTNPTLPRQMRHVQMAPSAYENLVRTLQLADGATFAVTFYGVEHDTTHTPSLYFAQREQALALEVIDRAHPDGRRFYVLPAGQPSAAPLPPGNECAVCHAERGSFDGTFAHMYPTLRPLNLSNAR